MNETTTGVILDFVEKYPLASLATAHDGIPYSSWVYLFGKPDFTFYFGTRSSTRKFEDLIHNDRASISLGNPVTLEILQLQAVATLVTDARLVRESLEEVRAIFTAQKKKWMSSADYATRGLYHEDVSRWIPPISQMREGSYAFVKLTPTWARLRKYDADMRAGKEFTEYVYQTPAE